jgi:hypothetical protein
MGGFYASLDCTDCPDTRGFGLSADVGLFHRLGLWSVRRLGLGLVDCADPDIGRTNLAPDKVLPPSDVALFHALNLALILNEWRKLAR